MDRNIMAHRKALVAILVLVVALVVTAGLVKSQTQGSRAAYPVAVQERPKGPIDLSTAIVKVANDTMPAVVYIEVTQSRTVENPLLPFEEDPFFRRFFGIPKMPKKFKQEITGLGSGMIIDASGHILTNNHVAAGATKMKVTLADGSSHDATLVGTDPKTDLAVIKISAPSRLPHVVFGDSDKIQVGEWVVAIGSPRALEKTVTQGIISAKHRTGISDPGGYQDFLQTDAPINPGNSGGPLLNLYGQVIGVNAAIATSSGGFEGIGFTIPSNIAVYVAKALITSGKVERGWLGVTIRDLTPELAKTAGVKGLSGALVVSVVKGGPADKGGLQKNDVVVGLNGKEIPDSDTFRNRVSETGVGAQIKLSVLRKGERREIRITTGGEKDAEKAFATSLERRLGADLRPPTAAEAEKYGLTPDTGVMIARLDPRGPLARAGFEVMDGILAVEGNPISGIEGLAIIMTAVKPGQKVMLLALDHRTGNTGTVAVVVR